MAGVAAVPQEVAEVEALPVVLAVPAQLLHQLQRAAAHVVLVVTRHRPATHPTARPIASTARHGDPTTHPIAIPSPIL